MTDARHTLLIMAFVMAPAALLQSQPPPVEGVVFRDDDRDGARDPGEPGIAGIAVSNQVDVVTTQADGSYRLAGPGTGVIFVSVPDGHRTTGVWWRQATAGRTDFGLLVAAAPREFSFVHASDTHVSAQSLPRLERLGAMVGDLKPDFVLVSGDLVRDALRVAEDEARGYYDLYVKAIAAFPVQVLSVPGNHEIFGIERHHSLVGTSHPLYGKGMYRARLGPTYYSFTYGGVHFVGLDTVDIEDLWYYGHVDRRQLAWLRADLARLPPGSPVVTFNHIPFVSATEHVRGYNDDPPAPTLIKVGGRLQFRHTVSNLADVLAIMEPYRWTHALGGHVHQREMVTFGSRVETRFFQTAAVVGPTTGPIPAISGVTLYRSRSGMVDTGTFLPLDEPSAVIPR